MEAILGILIKLGIDTSFFIQFVIVLFLFIVLKPLLFSRVLFVIQMRESKTSKLIEDSERKLIEAEDLGKKYKSKMDEVYTRVHDQLKKRKEDVLAREIERFKKTEDRINQDYENKRSMLMKEMQEKEGQVLSNANELSENLVNRLL